MLNQQVKEYWQSDLKRISIPANIRDKLPKETISFLEQIGLPAKNRLLQEKRDYIQKASLFGDRISEEEMLLSNPPIVFSDNVENKQFQNQNYCSLSVQFGRMIGVVLEFDTGKVFFINGTSPYAHVNSGHRDIRFMNESIMDALELFTRFLIGQHQYAMVAEKRNILEKQVSKYSLDNIPNDLKAQFPPLSSQMCEIFRTTEQNLRISFPSAFQKPEHFWSYWLWDWGGYCDE